MDTGKLAISILKQIRKHGDNWDTLPDLDKVTRIMSILDHYLKPHLEDSPDYVSGYMYHGTSEDYFDTDEFLLDQ
ncbi:hypothetical protein UFOVP1_44 [uncultured Caudovirales phage]|uniref:Uncharacterized protein n=1 Tax=uncultured Caudovirales phage TaxID=2100421 RepID=A0A6J5KL46_9CAUD|nr:hypothetical protein UFOVP1_44 [uncultured Caudovirales phage]